MGVCVEINRSDDIAVPSMDGGGWAAIQAPTRRTPGQAIPRARGLWRTHPHVGVEGWLLANNSVMSACSERTSPSRASREWRPSTGASS